MKTLASIVTNSWTTNTDASLPSPHDLMVDHVILHGMAGLLVACVGIWITTRLLKHLE